MNEFKQQQTRHEIEMEGQKQRILLQLEELINSFNKSITDKIDINNKSLSETKKEINVLINQMFSDIYRELKEQLAALGIYESNFYVNLLEENKEEEYKPANKSEINELLLGALFLGGTLRETLNYQKNVVNNNIVRNLNRIYNQTGIDSKSFFRNNVLNLNSAQLQTISRTATNNILNLSRLETFKKNNIKKYQYTAILDIKTTKICRNLDGNVYLIDNPKAPKPPQHYNCRSYIVPIIDSSDKFNDNEDFSDFAKDQSDKDYITDENGNFKLRNRDVVSLQERIIRDRKLFT